MEFSTEPVIKVKDAAIFQEDVCILSRVNFNIYKGEFVYLIGRTGSGKSSLLKTLYADLPFSNGDVHVVGYDLSKIKKQQVAFLRRKIGIIFQDFQLLHDRSVLENLLFVMKATGWKDRVK